MDKDHAIALKARIQAGDQSAKEELCQATIRFAYKLSWAWQRQLRYWDSDEIHSVCMLGFAVALERYNPTIGSILTYIEICVRSHVLDYLIQQNRVPKCEPLIDTDPPAIGLTSAQQAVEEIKTLFPLLRKKHAEIIELHYLKGYSLCEIADQFGFSKQRAHQLKDAAIKELKGIIHVRYVRSSRRQRCSPGTAVVGSC